MQTLAEPQSARARAAPTSTSSWSAPASPASTCCTGCAAWASRCACSKPAAASAARGTGTAIRARAATSRAWSTPTSSRDELQQEWDWSERYAAQPEILRYANHVADRFDLRRDIQFDTRVTAATLRRGREPLDDRDRRRRRAYRARFCVMATGCLSVAEHAEVRGRSTRSRARPTTPARWPHERRRLHRPARRHHRHRLVGGPVDPDHRRAGRAPRTCSSARRATRCRRATRRSIRRRCSRRSRPTTPALRARATAACATGSASMRRTRRAGARGERPRSASAPYEERWERGGLPFLGAFNDLLLDTRGQRHRGRVRARARSARSCTTRTSPSALADARHRLQAALRRHRLLRDVQPANVTLVDVQRDADRARSRRTA